MNTSGRAAWIGVMTAVALFYLAMTPLVLHYLDPVTGDEPFYIMTAISMLRDRDLNESNNYANRDFEEFYPPDPLPANWQGWPAFPRTLPPHPAITDRAGLFTKHGLGLSMLIAIPYELLGRTGAMLVVLLCGVLLSGQMYLFGRESGVRQHLAIIAALALGFAMPLAPYALLIFPEVPAGLLILYAVRRIALLENSTFQWLTVGAAIGFLPWLHQRFAVVSVVLAAIVLLDLWRTRSVNPLPALLPIAIGGFSIILYNFWLYGQPIQNTEDHDGFSGLSGTLNGAAGLLLDAQWGLLIVAPVAMIAIAAIPVWARRAPQVAVVSAATVVPYLIVVAAYQVWWGEWGPPARYLVPIVPLLAAPLATWLHAASRSQLAVAGFIWLVGFTLTVVGFMNPQRFYHHPDGVNNLYAQLGNHAGVDLAGLQVPYQFYSAAPLADRIMLAAVTIGIVVTLAVWIRHQASTNTVN